MPNVITQLNPKAPEGNEPGWSGPRPTIPVSQPRRTL